MNEYSTYNPPPHNVKLRDVDNYTKDIREQITMCTQLLTTKGIEYATEDKFHNFRVAAAATGVSMPEALAGMMVKHTVSIYDMCKHSEDFTMDKWEEKITDHINYLLILKAMLKEMERESNND